MKRTFHISCAVMLAIVTGCQQNKPTNRPSIGPGPTQQRSSSQSGAKETMERFRAVLLGDDINTAMWMLDNIDPSIPAAQSQRQKIKALSNRMKHQGYGFTVIEAKEIQDCAVVIIRDNQQPGVVNLDPVYLIDRDGRWLISPSLSTWNQMGYLSKAQYDRFKELKYWFEIRKAEYKVILGEKKPR